MITVLPGASEQLLLKVLATKCCHFYGVQSWCLSDKHTEQFITAWNRCARRILELHPATHKYIVSELVGWHPHQKDLQKLSKADQEHL
jgi:esterase/lipase superfamily enzyme